MLKILTDYLLKKFRLPSYVFPNEAKPEPAFTNLKICFSYEYYLSIS